MGKMIEQIWIGKTSIMTRALKLDKEIWTWPADHHTGQRLLENAAPKGLTEDRTRSLANLDQNLLALRAATTEVIISVAWY